MIRSEMHGTALEKSLLTCDRDIGPGDDLTVNGPDDLSLDGAGATQDAPVDERTCRWLSRARDLRAAGAWRRVLGLANRGHRRGIRHPNLMALGGEAALHLARPAEAIRLICWAQMAGLEEKDGAVSLLKGEALARLGTYATARRWLARALMRARRAGVREIEARAADRLATLPDPHPTGTRNGRSSTPRVDSA